MSPHARWGGSKIVAPLTPNREQELVGGLKNALDRGEPLAKAKQSFLNAGYKPAEIEGAVRKMPAASSQIVKPVADSRETPAAQPQLQPATTETAQPQPAATAKPPKPKEGISKKFTIILISTAVLVLIGAALIGVFWDKIF